MCHYVFFNALGIIRMKLNRKILREDPFGRFNFDYLLYIKKKSKDQLNTLITTKNS